MAGWTSSRAATAKTLDMRIRTCPRLLLPSLALMAALMACPFIVMLLLNYPEQGGQMVSPVISVSRSSWLALAAAAAEWRATGAIAPAEGGDFGSALSSSEAAAVADMLFAHLLLPSSGGNSSSSPLFPEELHLPEVQPLLALLKLIWQAHTKLQLSSPPAPAGNQCSGAAGHELLREAAAAARSLHAASCQRAAAAIEVAGKEPQSKEQRRLLKRTSSAGSRGAGMDEGLIALPTVKGTTAKGSASSLPSSGQHRAEHPLPSMPYVILRRLTIAILHVLYEQKGTGSTAAMTECQSIVREV